MVPWLNSSIGGGHVDIHGERRRLEREWGGEQPAVRPGGEA